MVIAYCPAVYFISEPTIFFCQLYIHKYYNTYLLLLLHLTSGMIDIPLPCKITEYKTSAICRVIFIWASNILWIHMNFIWEDRGENGSFGVEGCRPLL